MSEAEEQRRPWNAPPKPLAAALLVLVVAYGALLRFDAVTLSYGPVDRPQWLKSLQESRSPRSWMRPDGVTWSAVPLVAHRDGAWTKYSSDPYTYLQYARETRAFYAAHRREPIFPAVTRFFLFLLDQQDVAVSFASATCSTLAILATFLLGACAFSYWVGLGAALAFAVEFQVVSLGAGGWRDDLFTVGVLLFALAAISIRRAPTFRHAVFLGVAAGAVCLTRITSLSFVAPAFVWIAAASSRPRGQALRRVGVAACLAAVIVAPFLVNCWLVFGDPLHAINVHADVYRAAEGQSVGRSQTAREYLLNEWRARPFRTADTVALGMTTYPFTNKWNGFDPWVPYLGRGLSWFAIAGLIMWLGSGTGRLLLLVLASSLLPYAATWRLIGDWRFTEHAYPFFLLAACYAGWRLVSLVLPRPNDERARARATPRRIAGWVSTLAAIAAVTWFMIWVMPLATAWEALQAGEAATFMAGPRDQGFYVDNWLRPTRDGNIVTRTTRGAHAALRIPLPRARDYTVVIRMDPSPRPATEPPAGLPTAHVFLNDKPLATLPMTWDSGRVGSYRIQIPAAAVRAGFNRLALVVEPTSSDFASARVWYVQVRPNSP